MAGLLWAIIVILFIIWLLGLYGLPSAAGSFTS